MSRIRTVRRAKELAGTTAQIVKSSTVGGTRQVRCIKCPGMMAPATHHSGKKIIKCMSCGTEATTRSM